MPCPPGPAARAAHTSQALAPLRPRVGQVPEEALHVQGEALAHVEQEWRGAQVALHGLAGRDHPRLVPHERAEFVRHPGQRVLEPLLHPIVEVVVGLGVRDSVGLGDGAVLLRAVYIGLQTEAQPGDHHCGKGRGHGHGNGKVVGRRSPTASERGATARGPVRTNPYKGSDFWSGAHCNSFEIFCAFVAPRSGSPTKHASDVPSNQ